MTTATAVIPNVQALIMAGGQGERLYPLTAFRPKPAVPFGGVFRIVDFTLSNCLNSSLSRVSLLTQYMSIGSSDFRKSHRILDPFLHALLRH